jgi:hypothetical protein
MEREKKGKMWGVCRENFRRVGRKATRTGTWLWQSHLNSSSHCLTKEALSFPWLWMRKQRLRVIDCLEQCSRHHRAKVQSWDSNSGSKSMGWGWGQHGEEGGAGLLRSQWFPQILGSAGTSGAGRKLLAPASSMLFGRLHSTQWRVEVVVTGALFLTCSQEHSRDTS